MNAETTRTKLALRVFAAVIVGVVLMVVQVNAVELFREMAHQFPHKGARTLQDIRAHVERCPSWVLAVVVMMWGVTALTGVGTAGRIGNVWSAAAVGMLIVAALVCNVSILPYPLWFRMATLVLIPWAVVAGATIATRSKA